MKLELWVAWKLLAGNWRRAVFSFLAVTGGVIALIVSFSLGAGGEKIISRDLLAMSDNRIVIGGSNLTMQDIKILEGYPMVEYAVFPEARTFENGNIFRGYSDRALVTMGLTPLRDREIIVDKKQFPDIKIGDNLTFSINGREYSFSVRDLYEEINPLELMKQGNRVMISQSFYNRLFNTNDYRNVVVAFDKNEDIEEYMGYFISKFNKDRNSLRSVRVVETPEIYKRIVKIQKVVKNTLRLLSVISLCIGGLGIMNLIASGIKSRSAHIGIMRAMGMSGKKVTAVFLSEGIIVSLIGGVAGTVIGIIFSFILGKIIKIAPDFHIMQMGISILIAIIVGLGMGTIPARKIGHMNTVDALKNI